MKKSWPARLLDHLGSVRPYWALILPMLAGLGLCALSRALAFHRLTATIDGSTREVGYLSALHWSLNYVVVFPVTAYLMLTAYQQMREALGELGTRGMIRDRTSMEPRLGADPITDLTATTPQMALLVYLAFAIGFGVALGEVTVNNVWPLLSGADYQITKTSDWGEAFFLKSGQPAWLRYANAAFDVVAFVLEGIALSTVLLFFFYFVELASRLREFGRRADLIIVPDVLEPDPRRGFNVFQGPVQLMLYSSLGMFTMCYLSRIMKLYFDEGHSSNPWTFMSGDIGRALNFDLDRLRSWAYWEYWLAPGATTTLMDLVVASAGFILVLFITIIIGDLLRGVAKKSRDDLARWLASGTPLPGVPPGSDPVKALDSMVFWPVAYPSVRDFWALVGVTCVALVSYRLVLLVLITGFMAALKRVHRLLSEGKASHP